jgi:aspartate aminotransferase
VGHEPKLSPSRWTHAQAESAVWVRRMFEMGRRLRAEHGHDAVIDLALGQPLEAGELVREAFAKATRDHHRGRFAYMPNLGYPRLRERAAEEVAHPGLHARSIAMTCGAAGAINLALRTFVDPGDEILSILPHFAEYGLYAGILGAELVTVPSRADFHLDLDALAAALTPRTAALILNSPNNPTGVVTGDDEMAALARVLEDHAARTGRRVLLVVDEVYRQLTFAPAHHASALDHYPTSVLARSFSKDLGIAGERIGYLVLHPSLTTDDVIQGLETAQRAMGFVNAPATAQHALLNLGSWHVDPLPYRELRDHAVRRAHQAGLELVEPEGGIYLWMRCPQPDDVAFTAALAERHVLLAPGIAFGAPGHMRLCFTHPVSVLDRAIDVVGEVARSASPA